MNETTKAITSTMLAALSTLNQPNWYADHLERDGRWETVHLANGVNFEREAIHMSTFRALAKRGLIAYSHTNRGNDAWKRYAITDAGRAYLASQQPDENPNAPMGGGGDPEIEQFNVYGIEAQYGNRDDWFDNLLHVRRFSVAHFGGKPGLFGGFRLGGMRVSFDGGRQWGIASLSTPQLAASAEPLALTDADAPANAPETPDSSEPAFKVGDKVRFTAKALSELATTRRERFSGVLTVFDVFLTDSLPYGVKADGYEVNCIELCTADELEPASDTPADDDTITVPLDAFDALLHERRECEFHADLLSETLGEYMIAVSNHYTERDQLRADLAAANARIAALEGEANAVMLALDIELQDYINRLNRDDATVYYNGMVSALQDALRFMRYPDRAAQFLLAYGPRPEPPTTDPDPAPDGTGGGAPSAPIALVDAGEAYPDLPDATFDGRGPKAHTPQAFYGGFNIRPAHNVVLTMPYEPLGFGGAVDTDSMDHALLALSRDTVPASAIRVYKHFTAECWRQAIALRYVATYGSYPRLTTAGSEYAAALEAKQTEKGAA